MIKIDIHPAYLAGIADSDGSFSICALHKKRPNRSYVGIFQLTWTLNEMSENFIKLLKSKYGGSYFKQVGGRTLFKNSKPTIKYSLSGKKLIKFILDIQKYLILKYKQTENIIELDRTTEFGKYGNGRPKPENLKLLHHNLYLNNKELNSKNSGDRRKNDSI